MRKRAGTIVLAAGLLAAALSGCDEPPPKRPVDPVPSGGFDAAAADPFRPCTLMAIEDATQITGQPYFRTMSDNTVDGSQISCSYAIGVGGLQGVVQVELFHGDKTMTPDAMFAGACAREDGAGPTVQGPDGLSCTQKSGARVFLINDTVMSASVLGRWGEVDGPRSEALGARVAPRLKAALAASAEHAKASAQPN